MFLHPSYSFRFKAERNAAAGPRPDGDLRPDPQGLPFSTDLSLLTSHSCLTPKHISAPCSVEIRNFHTRFEFFVSLDKSEELETLNMNLFWFSTLPTIPQISLNAREGRQLICSIVRVLLLLLFSCVGEHYFTVMALTDVDVKWNWRGPCVWRGWLRTYFLVEVMAVPMCYI